MPTQLSFFWPDGEKIPDEHLRSVYRHPPLVPDRFNRGALVVGSRGAGKTTLLRFQKESHPGVALHVALNTELASLSKQTALGPLSPTTSATQEELLGNKATSLIAVSVAERLAKKSITPPWDELRECLPGGALPSKRGGLAEFLAKTKINVSRGALDEFGAVPRTRPLVSFLSSLGRRCEQLGLPLLLLFDKADLVIPAALIPVLETLDQAAGYVAVVATRPGHGGLSLARSADSSSPGDHYDVVYLGLWPRSDDWRAFVESAIQAQPSIGSLSGIADDLRNAVVALSRDSVRVGLEAFAYIQASPANAHRQLSTALREIQTRQLTGIQAVLRDSHPDFPDFLERVRHAVLTKGPIRGPVTLSIESGRSARLFDGTSELSTFLDAALRSAALCVAEGDVWVPGGTSRRVEVPPHLLWRDGDPLWSSPSCLPINLSLRESDVFRSSGGPASPPTVFIAYRMQNRESGRFRETLEGSLTTHPTIRCRVEDGRVPVGHKWAKQIRDRIKRAKLVIGDVEGMRPEVLFELGFANGLRTPVLPVVSSAAIADVPYWLRATQLGHYSDARGVAEIISSVETHLAQAVRGGSPRGPTSSLVVWLRKFPWNADGFDQVETAARREGLNFEAFEAADSEDVVVDKARLATFLVIALDGSAWDSFGHFVCGTALAKPYAGYGAKRLSRRIVIIEPPSVTPKKFTGEGVSRCSDTVVVTKQEFALEEFERFAARRRAWER
jgi:hypothetical protein